MEVKGKGGGGKGGGISWRVCGGFFVMGRGRGVCGGLRMEGEEGMDGGRRGLWLEGGKRDEGGRGKGGKKGSWFSSIRQACLYVNGQGFEEYAYLR